MYNELKEKGEIVETSPLYDTLRPIAEAISRVAQPRYNHPFKFFIVHETQPNAFATPGGNVYVVNSLFYFVKSTEQLAGTLCHEVSHSIHHDAVRRLQEQRRIEAREIGAALLLGPSLAQILAIQMLSDLLPLLGSHGVHRICNARPSTLNLSHRTPLKCKFVRLLHPRHWNDRPLAAHDFLCRARMRASLASWLDHGYFRGRD